MAETLITEELERFVRNLSASMFAPRERECLVCFVDRYVQEFGCNGTHRFAMHYRDERAPRATALDTRLAAIGACCCDCEIMMNGYVPARHLWMFPDGPQGDPEFPREMPPCHGVRRGTIRPCENWIRYDRNLKMGFF